MATIKLWEQNQGFGLLKQPSKIWFYDLYYVNSHKDCYRFYLQCEDQSDTTRAKKLNRISFAVLVFRRLVIQHWYQHKCHSKAKVTIILAEFKSFLWKNRGDDQTFPNNIFDRFKRDFQYQLESILDWAAHLKHLQFILLKYDLTGAPNKSTMLKYFRKSLKLFILAELDHWELKLESFNQMIKKVIRVEAKTAFWLYSYTWKMD